MDNDLISRKELLDWLTNPTGFRTYCKNCCGIDCLNCLIGEAIKNAPTVDAVPVRRGKWIEEQGQTFIPVEYDEFDNPVLHDYILYRCSQCGRIENKKEPYCNCGADMREVNMLVTPPIC